LAGNGSRREGPKEHHFRQPFIAGDVLLFFNPKKDQKKVTLKMAPRHVVVSVLTHSISTFPFMNISTVQVEIHGQFLLRFFYVFHCLSPLVSVIVVDIILTDDVIVRRYYPLKYVICSIILLGSVMIM